MLDSPGAGTLCTSRLHPEQLKHNQSTVHLFQSQWFPRAARAGNPSLRDLGTILRDLTAEPASLDGNLRQASGSAPSSLSRCKSGSQLTTIFSLSDPCVTQSQFEKCSLASVPCTRGTPNPPLHPPGSQLEPGGPLTSPSASASPLSLSFPVTPILQLEESS